MQERPGRGVILLLFLILWVMALTLVLEERSRVSGINENSIYQESFRRQELPSGLYRQIMDTKAKDVWDVFTATMARGSFAPDGVCTDYQPFLKYKKKEYLQLRQSYQAIWADVKYFPVAGEDIYFEDTYGAVREYGGQRTHEGTDLFGPVTEPGYYPVVSVTDGVAEKIGWLPLGGYRIGIRSPHGGYFYYAHLSEYDHSFKEGELVQAGDILGYMGNTGYGPKGTKGRFPVHLHVGIYLRTPRMQEMSVDPYYILKMLQERNSDLQDR
nr:M23 family metallopeptidase [uncultured Blautia sp.]